MCRRLPFLPLATIVLFACESPPGPDLDDSPMLPSAEIVDAMHEDGRAGFYFLSPLVPDPGATGAFDPAFLPFLAVEICEWNGSECVEPLVARFTSEEGIGRDAAVSVQTSPERPSGVRGSFMRHCGPRAASAASRIPPPSTTPASCEGHETGCRRTECLHRSRAAMVNRSVPVPA